MKKNNRFKYVPKKVTKSLKPNQKKEVKRLIKSDHNANDENKLNAPATWSPGVDQSGSVQCVSSVRQGSAFNQRDGDCITMKKLRISADWTNRLSGNVDYELTLRFVVARDTMQDGVDPACTDLFEHKNDPLSEYNHVHQLNNPKRFQILWDKTFICDAQANGQGTPRCRHFQKFIKLKGKKAKFLGDAGTAADNGKGHIYIFALVNTGTASDSALAVDYSLTYTDD